MQGHRLREKSIPLPLPHYPLAANYADLTVQRFEIRVNRQDAALAQPRSLEAGVGVARIGDKRLPLGVQQRNEARFRDTQQWPEYPAIGELSDGRHPREAVRPAAGAATDQVGLHLILAMMGS